MAAYFIVKTTMRSSPNNTTPRDGTRLGSSSHTVLAMAKDSVEHPFDELVAGAVGLLPGGSLGQRAGSRLAREVRKEHARRRSVALAAAVRMSGLGSTEDLAEAISDKPKDYPC